MDFIRGELTLGDTALHTFARKNDKRGFLIEVSRFPLHLFVANHENKLPIDLLPQEMLISCIREGALPLSIISEVTKSTLLHWAAEKGTRAIVDSILRYCLSYHDVNQPTQFISSLLKAQNNQGQTPLHLAVINNRVDIVKLLLNSVFDLYHDFVLRDNEGYTVLHVAAKTGSIEMIALLMQKDRNLLFVNNISNIMPLDLFSEVTLRDLILQKIIDPLWEEVSSGNTLLHWASAKGISYVIECALQHTETQINVMNKESWTPIYMAVRNQQQDSITTLLNESEINLLLQDTSGDTPLHIAIGLVNKAIIKQLIVASPKALFIKNKAGHCAINLLNESYFDEQTITAISQDSKMRDDLTIWAIQHGYIAVLKTIYRNLDINSYRNISGTLAHFVVFWNNIPNRLEILDYLIESRINLLIPNDKGMPPLQMAIHRYNGSDIHDAIIQKLIVANNTLFHYQGSKNKDTLLHSLLKASVSDKKYANLLTRIFDYIPKSNIANIQNDQGETPLIIAVKSNMLLIAQRLLEKFDIQHELRDDQNYTWKDYAKNNTNVYFRNLETWYSDEGAKTVEEIFSAHHSPSQLALKEFQNNHYRLHRLAAENNIDGFIVEAMYDKDQMLVRDRDGRLPFELFPEAENLTEQWKAIGALPSQTILANNSPEQNLLQIMEHNLLPFSLVLDSSNNTYLHWLANKGYVQVIEEIAPKTKNIVDLLCATNNDGYSPLGLMSTDVLNDLIKERQFFKNLFIKENKQWKKILRTAMDIGASVLVQEILMEENAFIIIVGTINKTNINRMTDRGTLAHLVVENSNIPARLDILGYLIREGIDFNLRNHKGTSPLCMLINKLSKDHQEDIEICARIIQAAPEQLFLEDKKILDILSPRKNILKALFSSSSFPHNYQYPQTGDTLLHWAASKGKGNILDMLLNKTDLSFLNKSNLAGETLLITAAKHNKIMILRYLIQQPNIDQVMRDQHGKDWKEHAGQYKTPEMNTLIQEELAKQSNTVRPRLR